MTFIDKFFDIIGNFIADGITEIIIDNDYRFACALIVFSFGMLSEMALAYLYKKDRITMAKGIFIGCLSFNIVVTLTAIMLCKLWFALIICTVVVIIMPIYEKKELREYLKSDFTYSKKKYFVYIFTSILSIFVGIMLTKVL